MECNIKVSIIVAIYNVEKYLERCIESLVNQKFKYFEIILVNDGSTDNCGEICDAYAINDNRIKVIHKKNGGLSDARNSGIKESKGEYLLFIDSDDWCEPNMVEEMFNKITKNNCDLAICGYSIDYTNNNYKIKKTLKDLRLYNGYDEIAEAIYNLDKEGMLNVVWNKMYKRSVIEKNSLIFEKDGMPGEDLMFNCRYFTYIKNIMFIDLELYHYMREDEDTLVSKYRKNLYQQVQRFNKSRKDMYNYYNMNSKEYITCYANSYIFYIFTCILNLYRVNSKLSAKDRRDFIKSLVNDNEINYYLDNSNEENFHIRLFKLLIKLRSATFMELVYRILFFGKNNFRKIYRILRKKIS